MANLTESTTYDAGVYQLETTDPVTGGAAGIANAPLKNLANRTNYLKSRVDSLESGATIPPTLAPLASPSFSGNPTAPTPALGDNDTSLATTAFVQKTVAGYLTKSVAGGVNVTLTSVEAGNGILNFTGALTANISVIVPTSPTGIWVVANNTTGTFTLTIKTAAGSGVVVTQGKSETLYCDGTSVYEADTDLLANILAVDGAGSGVDADLLDGLHGASYARSGVNSDITSLNGLTSSAKSVYGFLYKADANSAVFSKTGAGTAQIKAGTVVDVGGAIVTFSAATAITMPTLTAGTDYAIWVTPAGALQAVADPYSAPATAPVAGARKIGGFHYGLVAAGTTVASGSFATTGNGMIWTQSQVDDIAGINKYSFWDLKWRCAGEQRGMALDPYVRCWAAIYFCSTNHISNGISRFNTDVASGTVLPRIPLAYGGNGTAAYANGNWWTFGEIAASFGLRHPTEREFVSAAYGVTENQSLGGAASTIPSTARQAGYTSRIGLDQASGHHWTWGADSSTRWDGTATPWAWRDVNGGRGQLHLYGDVNLIRVLLGGDRGHAAVSGSRASSWPNGPWHSFWSLGLRAFGDHLMLD